MKTIGLNRPTISAIAALMFLTAAALPARAQVITTNGGFEAGFTGWTRADQLGSQGTFALQSGTTSPVNGTTVPAPPGGTTAAMTDAQGPGSHVLFQNFVVPNAPLGLCLLQFDIFIGNRSIVFNTPSPASLDFSTPALNQQARVDIIGGATDPFSVLPIDVLFNAYQTAAGDPLVSGYTTVTRDVTALLTANQGNTLRLRFAEVDNVAIFQNGVDNVSVTVNAIPEPSAMVLCGMGTILGLGRLIRRPSAQRPTPEQH